MKFITKEFVYAKNIHKLEKAFDTSMGYQFMMRNFMKVSGVGTADL